MDAEVVVAVAVAVVDVEDVDARSCFGIWAFAEHPYDLGLNMNGRLMVQHHGAPFAFRCRSDFTVT